MRLIMNPLFILQLSAVLGVAPVAEQNRLPETRGSWVSRLKPGEKTQWEPVKGVALRHEKKLIEKCIYLFLIFESTKWDCILSLSRHQKMPYAEFFCRRLMD